MSDGIVGHRDADARVDVEVEAGDVERLADLGEELVDALQRLLFVGGLHEHRELVAAEPGDQIGRGQQRPQPPADLHEELVAERVAQACR